MSMSNRNTVNLLQMGTFLTANVVFRNDNGRPSKPYTYKFPKDWDLNVGDFAIVDSPSEGYKVVKVVEVHEENEVVLDDRFPYVWLVCKVDTDWHMQQQKRERQALRVIQASEQRKQQQELMENLGLLNGGTQEKVKNLVSPDSNLEADEEMSDAKS